MRLVLKFQQISLLVVFSLLVLFSAQLAYAAKGVPGKDAAYVVDANTGKVLYSRSSTRYRYPASLTKVMTIYLMLQEIEAGRMNLNTRIRMTKRGAAQQPSKLAMKIGDTISASDAIKALVVKSANDVAVAVAEHISGTEWKFTQRMTRTAHSLGMKATTFRNANGLPDSQQRTTAKDMVTLGRAMYRDYPQYIKYFRTQTFTYKGRTYKNFNKLVGTISGVDGIKTGYIRASGYNLLSSKRVGNKHVIAVVMGGKTGTTRNTEMVRLLDYGIKKAKSVTKKPQPKPQNLLLSYAAVPQPKPKTITPSSSVKVASVTPITKTEPEWSIQIGAVKSKVEAGKMLSEVRNKMGSALSAAKDVTPSVNKSGTTLYRARFAGLSEKLAKEICENMKKKEISCYAIK